MKSFMAKSINGEGTIVVIVDGVPYSADDSHMNYRMLSQAYKDGDAEAFINAFDVTAALESYAVGPAGVNAQSGNVSVKDGQISYLGEDLRSSLVDRIYDMMRKGYEFEHMLVFLDNLHANPSKSSFDQLHSFLENKSLPISTDGCFLAYKTVKIHRGADFTDVYGNLVTEGDLVDKYTGRVRNNVGDSPNMPRHKVDDNPGSHCSTGYHVGSLEYAGPGGWYNSSQDVVIIVKVDPRDAVSVPNDHSFQKLRTCKYTVVSLYKGEMVRPVYDDEDDDWFEDDSFAQDEIDHFSDVEDDIDPRDLMVGDEATCQYTDRHGDTKYRIFVVEEVQDNGQGILVELLDGDPSYHVSSDIRMFNFDRMDEVLYLER